MTIHEAPTPQHWNYFLSLEDDIVRLARYLEPTTDNFASYSLELARILFAAASEVDVVSKRLCKKLNKRSRADKITEYRKEILRSCPRIKDALVQIPRFGLTLNPWEQWGKDASPVWWRAYNNVKHRRDSHFFEASLKNALNSLGGLFVLLLFFYRDEAHKGQLSPDPNLFRAGAPFHTEKLLWAPHSTTYTF